MEAFHEARALVQEFLSMEGLSHFQYIARIVYQYEEGEHTYEDILPSGTTVQTTVAPRFQSIVRNFKRGEYVLVTIVKGVGHVIVGLIQKQNMQSYVAAGYWPFMVEMPDEEEEEEEVDR